MPIALLVPVLPTEASFKYQHVTSIQGDLAEPVDDLLLLEGPSHTPRKNKNMFEVSNNLIRHISSDLGVHTIKF